MGGDHGTTPRPNSAAWRATARWLALAAASIVAAVLALPVRAQAPSDDDLPGRVGRIAEFAGQLFLAPQEHATEWSPIGVNYPVTSGDNLWVSGDGRAEIDYGGGQFRLAGDTNLHVSRLDDRQLALFVAQGRLILRVRVLDAGDAATIDTPNTQVALTRPGLYRIDVSPDRQATTVAVREGEAQVALASGAQQALPGQALTVTGSDPAQAQFLTRAGVDGFDAWSADRDRRYERGGSATYVSRQMIGVAELDEYGYWENTQTYGPVWYPTAVAPDWAPYRYGYWTSVGGWGLTWVDSAPWGYAPSHYGRWVRVGPRWGWCPGGYVARPHWAPALVGWVGGAAWGVSASGGNPVYGWVPLGWGDAYHPWWRRCSNNCWTHYNRPYAVNVNVRPAAPPPRYSNAAVPGALTAVAAPTLGSRRPVPQNIVPLPSSFARSAPVLATAPPVARGSAQVPAVRPGERGTPPPASSHPSRTWQGRNGRGVGDRPPAPFGQAPSRREAPPSQAAPATGVAPSYESRRGAPPVQTPQSGVPVATTPPARPGAAAGAMAPTAPTVPSAPSAPSAPISPSAPSASGPATPQASSVPQVPPSAPAAPSAPQARRGGVGAGGQAAGSPPASAAAATGVPMPPPRAAPSPQAAGRAGHAPAGTVPVAPARPGHAGPPAAAGVPAAASPSGRGGPVPAVAPPPSAQAPAATPAPAAQHGRPAGAPATTGGDGGRDPGGNTVRK